MLFIIDKSTGKCFRSWDKPGLDSSYDRASLAQYLVSNAQPFGLAVDGNTETERVLAVSRELFANGIVGINKSLSHIQLWLSPAVLTEERPKQPLPMQRLLLGTSLPASRLAHFGLSERVSEKELRSFFTSRGYEWLDASPVHPIPAVQKGHNCLCLYPAQMTGHLDMTELYDLPYQLDVSFRDMLTDIYLGSFCYDISDTAYRRCAKKHRKTILSYIAEAARHMDVSTPSALADQLLPLLSLPRETSFPLNVHTESIERTILLDLLRQLREEGKLCLNHEDRSLPAGFDQWKTFLQGGVAFKRMLFGSCRKIIGWIEIRRASDGCYHGILYDGDGFAAGDICKSPHLAEAFDQSDAFSNGLYRS